MNLPTLRRPWAGVVLAAATVVALAGGCSKSPDTTATVLPPINVGAPTPTVTVAAVSPVVGTWVVDVGAPYRPHLFVFGPPAGPGLGGPMTSTNPTNVQQVNSDGTPGTNDSVGQGWWRPTTGGQVMFRFVELNASAKTHKPAPLLVVEGLAWLTDGGRLTGKAKAYYAPADTRKPLSVKLPPANQIIDTTFDGWRLDVAETDPLMVALLTALPTGGHATPTATPSG